MFQIEITNLNKLYTSLLCIKRCDSKRVNFTPEQAMQVGGKGGNKSISPLFLEPGS